MTTQHNIVWRPRAGPRENASADQDLVAGVVAPSMNESCETVCGDCRVCRRIKRGNITAWIWPSMFFAIMSANLYYLGGGR